MDSNTEGRAELRDVYDFNLLIAALRRKKRWRDALQVTVDMCSRATLPDAVSLNSAAVACNGPAWRETLGHLRRSKSFDNFPNLITYNTCINACEGSRRWLCALQIFGHLQKEGFEMDIVSFGSVLHVLRGHWERTSLLLQSMPVCGLRPNLYALNSVLSLSVASK